MSQISLWENVTSFGGILKAANSAAGEPSQYLFWTSMYVLVLFVILMTFVYYQGMKIALLATGFVGIVIGLLMLYLDLIAPQALFMIVGLEVVMIWVVYITNRNN